MDNKARFMIVLYHYCAWKGDILGWYFYVRTEDLFLILRGILAPHSTPSHHHDESKELPTEHSKGEVSTHCEKNATSISALNKLWILYVNRASKWCQRGENRWLFRLSVMSNHTLENGIIFWFSCIIFNNLAP